MLRGGCCTLHGNTTLKNGQGLVACLDKCQRAHVDNPTDELFLPQVQVQKRLTVGPVAVTGVFTMFENTEHFSTIGVCPHGKLKTRPLQDNITRTKKHKMQLARQDGQEVGGWFGRGPSSTVGLGDVFNHKRRRTTLTPHA
jgi:hypothetical protein